MQEGDRGSQGGREPKKEGAKEGGRDASQVSISAEHATCYGILLLAASPLCSAQLTF